MPTHLAQRDHTNAVVAVLEGTGHPVGRGVRNSEPDGSGTVLPPPCFVVHPLPGGTREGTLDDWTQHASMLYQVTCVGKTQSQAELVRDLSEVLLDGITVPGRIIDVVKVDFGSDEAVRDDSLGAPKLLFSAKPRYRLFSVPA